MAGLSYFPEFSPGQKRNKSRNLLFFREFLSSVPFSEQTREFLSEFAFPIILLLIQRITHPTRMRKPCLRIRVTLSSETIL
jgi:hypothetical protein